MFDVLKSRLHKGLIFVPERFQIFHGLFPNSFAKAAIYLLQCVVQTRELDYVDFFEHIQVLFI